MTICPAKFTASDFGTAGAVGSRLDAAIKRACSTEFAGNAEAIASTNSSHAAKASGA